MPSGWKGWAYFLLKLSNDVNAVNQARKKNSMKPITNRIGRRIYGKAAGRLAGRIFKP